LQENTSHEQIIKIDPLAQAGHKRRIKQKDLIKTKMWQVTCSPRPPTIVTQPHGLARVDKPPT